MKIDGNCLTGDFIQVENFTKQWCQVTVDMKEFYRKYDSLCESDLGLWTGLDDGNRVYIRLQDDNDLGKVKYLIDYT